MRTERWSLQMLVDLARETAGAEWPPIVAAAKPLDPAEKIVRKILVGDGFYGQELLDGWHRVAGMLAWATMEGFDPDDIYGRVRILTPRETALWKARYGS